MHFLKNLDFKQQRIDLFLIQWVIHYITSLETQSTSIRNLVKVSDILKTNTQIKQTSRNFWMDFGFSKISLCGLISLYIPYGVYEVDNAYY